MNKEKDRVEREREIDRDRESIKESSELGVVRIPLRSYGGIKKKFPLRGDM